MKPQTPKTPRPVVVEWGDSWSPPSTDIYDIEDLQDRGGEPLQMVDVGFLIRRDDDGFLLGATLVSNDDNEGIGRVRGISFIPAAMVISVRRLDG